MLSEKSTVFMNLNSFGVILIKKNGKYSPHGAFWGILPMTVCAFKVSLLLCKKISIKRHLVPQSWGRSWFVKT